MVTIDDAQSLPFALRRDVEAQRRLYAVLSSPKRMFYVHGIVVLWDLHCAKRWITKDDFVETLATRFENYLIEGNLGVRDEFLDKNFSIEEEDCADEEDPSLQARIVFRRLHETGWFELFKDAVEGSLRTTLVVGEQASRLAEFVAAEQRHAHVDSTSCVLNVRVGLEHAQGALNQMRSGSRGLDDAVLRSVVGRELCEALKNAQERSAVLNARIRRTCHEFKLTSMRIAGCRTQYDLQLVMDDYEQGLFDSIMQPLRIEDGFDRNGDAIVRMLDAWSVDSELLSLVHETSRLPGMPEGLSRPFEFIQDVRYAYAVRVRDAWEYALSLEKRITSEMSKKHRMLLGGTSTMAAAYERAIMHIAQSDDALAACALEAMQGVLFLPGKGPFDDSCLSTFRAHDDAEKMNRVRIVDRGDMATVCRADAVAESALTRAGKKMQRMIARQGSLDGSSLPLSSRADRVEQMLYVLAADSKDSTYVVPRIDDEDRVVSDGQNIARVRFVERASR
ncbi:Wadjet anti-phage system protein JetA family protein [Slackia piriformis]